MSQTLTLTGRGVTLTLFAPRPVAGGLEADALTVSAPLHKPRTFKSETDKRRFTAPPIPERGFLVGHIFLKEVK